MVKFGNKRQMLVALLLVLFSVGAQAQWAVGISGGWSWNNPTIDRGYSNYQYSGRSGYNVGIIGRYQFMDWLAVRTDLRLTSRCYKMEREMENIGLDNVYTIHRDLYLHLPVMADFSVGGKKLRGHFYAGAYIGGWIDTHRSGLTFNTNLNVVPFEESTEFDSNRDNRFNAGLIGGIGLNYLINKHFEVLVEGFYMYDLSKSNKTSCIGAYPRYNSTTDVNVGVIYNF